MAEHKDGTRHEDQKGVYYTSSDCCENIPHTDFNPHADNGLGKKFLDSFSPYVKEEEQSAPL
jgi:hypothetical protein